MRWTVSLAKDLCHAGGGGRLQANCNGGEFRSTLVSPLINQELIHGGMGCIEHCALDRHGQSIVPRDADMTRRVSERYGYDCLALSRSGSICRDGDLEPKLDIQGYGIVHR